MPSFSPFFRVFSIVFPIFFSIKCFHFFSSQNCFFFCLVPSGDRVVGLSFPFGLPKTRTPKAWVDTLRTKQVLLLSRSTILVFDGERIHRCVNFTSMWCGGNSNVPCTYTLCPSLAISSDGTLAAAHGTRRDQARSRGLYRGSVSQRHGPRAVSCLRTKRMPQVELCTASMGFRSYA